MSDLCQKAIGKRIKLARNAKGCTQEQLSEAIGMTTKNLSQIECGNVGFSLPVLATICKHLETSADYILFGVRNAEHASPIPLLLSELNEEEQAFGEKLLSVYVEACKQKNK